MQFIADFHIHSRYSRATSRDMNIETLAHWAKIKGIGLLGTGDFTHPNYFAELRLRLKPTGKGLFVLKKGDSTPHFILTTEICNMFSQKGQSYRTHSLIFAPSFEVISKINTHLKKLGKLASDGRPIFGQPVKEMVKLVLDVSPDCFFVPAHVWTPWFSLFGANSGFDSIEECFGEETKNIHCIETGLSSDPAMNWRLSALDKITLISNSDAHSPRRLGREANVFNCELDYQVIIDTLKNRDANRFLYTVEFFPEEGKYHFDGHRNCNIVFSPAESKKHNNTCPVCKRQLTLGVMHRVEALADRPEGYLPQGAIPAKHLVQLEEIIGEALGVSPNTTAVKKEYDRLVEKCRSEFNILLNLSLDNIARYTTDRVVEGIKLVREGKLKIAPGYDGEYGKISIFDGPPKSSYGFSFPPSTETTQPTQISPQMRLF